MIKMRFLATAMILCNCAAITIVNNGVAADSTNFSNNNAPSYENGVLTIPRVDTPDQVGNYQDAVLRFNPKLSTWVLQQVIPAKFNSSNPRIKSVNVFVINDSFPTQVFLQVIGDFTCGEFGQINIGRKENLFDIQISVTPTPPGQACTTDITEFVRVIQLDVYRLSAGDYQYSINGGNQGTFTLTKDNKFGECGGTSNTEEICETEVTTGS